MTFILSRNYRYFLLSNAFLLSAIMFFVSKKIGPIDNIETIKFLGSRLLYLYLVGWCLLFLVFFYNYFSSLYKKIAWCITGVFYSALLGILFNPYPKIDIIYGDNTIEISNADKNENTAMAKISFVEIDPLLKKYLVFASQGKIKAFTHTRFFFMGNCNYFQVLIKNKILNHAQGNIELSSEIINEFLKHKEMTINFTFQKEQVLLFRERDYGKYAITRRDQLFVNEQRVSLKHDGVLNIPFYFEDLQGVPLAFFH